MKNTATTSVQPIKAWAKGNKITAIQLMMSPKGKLFLADQDSQHVAGAAEDIDFKKPVQVGRILDKDTNETWFFAFNGEPATVVETMNFE